MNGNLAEGIRYFLDGFKLITKPGLRVYVFVPLLINFALFSFASWYSYSLYTDGVSWLLSKVPDWLSFIEWILLPIFILTMGTIIFFVFNMVANIVASPFNGILAEKTELYLINQDNLGQDGGFSELIKIVPHSIMRELHKLKYYLPRFIVLTLITFWIPGLNILVFLFGAWMMSIQYVDYPMDNHKISIKDMIALIKKRNLSAIGFGGVVMFSLMIPILNFVVIPAAVCGACIFWVKELKDK